MGEPVFLGGSAVFDEWAPCLQPLPPASVPELHPVVRGGHPVSALAHCHCPQVSAAEELSNVKQAMAMMSRQHYMEVKRLRDGTSGATSSPLSGSQSTAAYSLEPAGDATSSPPPAHRLHIQLHQKERQLAEATAAAQAEATKREALVSSCRQDSTTQSCCLPGLAAAWEASSASSLTLLSHTPTHPPTHTPTHTRAMCPLLSRVSACVCMPP